MSGLRPKMACEDLVLLSCPATVPGVKSDKVGTIGPTFPAELPSGLLRASRGQRVLHRGCPRACPSGVPRASFFGYPARMPFQHPDGRVIHGLYYKFADGWALVVWLNELGESADGLTRNEAGKLLVT